MFRFRGSSMLGRAPAQTSDDVFVEIPNEELGLLFHAINDSTDRRRRGIKRPYVEKG